MSHPIQWSHHVLLPVKGNFAFDQRVSQEHIVWYLTKGAVDIKLNEQAWLRYGVDSLIWFPHGEPHSVRCPNARPFTCYSFRFKARLSVQRAVGIDQAQRYLPLIDDLYQECLLEDGADQERVQALLYLITSSIERQQLESASETVQRGKFLSDKQRQTLSRYVQLHVQDQIHPADLADELGYSADYFSRLFKRSYGKAPKRWLMEQRIRMAQYFLSDSYESIRVIAERCGYQDQNIFSRQFKQVLGYSPSQYRHRLHN